MANKKNIQASNLTLINSQAGTMNSLNGNNPKGNASNTNDFKQKSNSAIQPGIVDTKGKR
jgi:hypothetical protein